MVTVQIQEGPTYFPLLQSPPSLLCVSDNVSMGQIGKGGKLTAQVKNEWGYASTPPICLQDMNSDNSGFLLYFTYLPVTIHKTYNIVLFT